MQLTPWHRTFLQEQRPGVRIDPKQRLRLRSLQLVYRINNPRSVILVSVHSLYLEERRVDGQISVNTGLILSQQKHGRIVILISDSHPDDHETRPAATVGGHHRYLVQLLFLPIQFLSSYNLAGQSIDVEYLFHQVGGDRVHDGAVFTEILVGGDHARDQSAGQLILEHRYLDHGIRELGIVPVSGQDLDLDSREARVHVIGDGDVQHAELLLAEVLHIDQRDDAGRLVDVVRLLLVTADYRVRELVVHVVRIAGGHHRHELTPFRVFRQRAGVRWLLELGRVVVHVDHCHPDVSRAREARHPAIDRDHREVMRLVSLVVQRSLQEDHTLLRIDVEQVRAVLRVVLNRVANLLVYVWTKRTSGLRY